MKVRSTFERYVIGVSFVGLLLGLIVIHQLAFPTNGLPSDIMRPIGADFLTLWAGPQVPLSALLDVNVFMDHLERMMGFSVYEHIWAYPLTALFLGWPLAQLPYYVAVAVWYALGVCLYLCVLARAMRPEADRWLLIAMAVSPFVLLNLVVGQNGLFTAAASLGALMLLGSRPVLAGILIGLLSFKPQLGILWPLVLLCTGSWRAFFAASVVTVALVALSLGVHGLAAWQSYFAVMGPVHWQVVTAPPLEQGQYTYHLMMPGVLTSLRLIGVGVNTALAAQLIVSLSAAVATCIVFRRSESLPVRALAMAAGGMLISPYGFNYDMAFLGLALVLCWRVDVPTTLRERYLHGSLFLSPWLIFKFNAIGAPIVPLLLLWALAYAYRKART